MKLNHAKNILIIVLAFIAVIQIGELWFGDVSNRNFFYTFFSPERREDTLEEQKNIVSPFRFITSFGNKNFYIDYKGIPSTVYGGVVDNIVAAAVRDGEFAAAKELQWDEILKNRAVIYQYAVYMPSEPYAKALGQKNNSITSKVKFFDYVAVVPFRNTGERLKVIFIDAPGGMAYEYGVNQNTLNENLLKAIQSSQEASREMYYISSAQSGLDVFAKNEFIPQWTSPTYVYPLVRTLNPYLIDETMEKNVAYFFDNPTKVWAYSENRVYTYSDEKTVVKYMPNGVIEYSNYSTVTKSYEPDFLYDFCTALSFLRRDIRLANDYYLSGYNATSKAYTFYFGYVVNNMPIMLSEKAADKTGDDGIKHFIEVTVENGQVTKYRKTVEHFVADNTAPQAATLDFFRSLNSIGISGGKTRLNTATIGYRFDKSPQLFLFWNLNINGAEYMRSAQ